MILNLILITKKMWTTNIVLIGKSLLNISFFIILMQCKWYKTFVFVFLIDKFK